MAHTHFYVDPASGVDAAGRGTKALPVATVQYLLDNYAGSKGTGGNQVNIKAGTDDVLSATLDFSTWGIGSQENPNIFRGYTTDENDGGIGGISGGGTVGVKTSTNNVNWSFWIDLHLHNCGSQTILNLDDGNLICNVEFDNTTGSAVFVDRYPVIINSNFHNIGATGIDTGIEPAYIYGNYFKNGTNKFDECINSQMWDTIERNIMSIDGASVGVRSVSSWIRGAHNSIFSNAGTGKGFRFEGSGNDGAVIHSNLIEGFSGSGGQGIEWTSVGVQNAKIIAANSLYNNATNENTPDSVGHFVASEVLGSSPFAKSGSDTYANRFTYFEPQDVGDVIGGAFGYNGDRGAVQSAAAAGASILQRLVQQTNIGTY